MEMSENQIWNEFWGHDSHLLTSDVTFCAHLDLSLIVIKKNDKKLRMQELSAPLAVCHDSCYHWSWCNTLQSEPLQQIITVVEYSRKCSLITHGLQDSVHVSLDLQNMIVASFFQRVLWHLLTGVPAWHWKHWTLQVYSAAFSLR